MGTTVGASEASRGDEPHSGFAPPLEQESVAAPSLEFTVARLVARTAAAMGEAYFATLASGLHEILNLRSAFVLERDARHEMLTVRALCHDGSAAMVEPYPLADAAAQRAFAADGALIQCEARSAFPRDPLLQLVDASSVLIVPVRASDGAPNGFIGVAHDRPLDDPIGIEALLRLVSPRVGAELERMRITAELLQQSELLLAFTEHAQDMILRTVPGDPPRVEYVNPAFERFTGYPRSDLYADPMLLLRLAHPDDRALFAKMYVDGETDQPRIWRWIRRDGSMLWTEGRRRHVLDAAGNVVAFETISRDITERVEAEDRARAAERMEQLIVSAIPDSVLQVARTGTITAVLHGDVTPSPFAVQPRDGALLADLLPAEAAPAVMRQLGIALVSKQVEVARFEISGRETDLVFEVRIAPVDSEQAIAFFRNVTGDAYLKRAVERDRTKEELEGKAERRILRANPYALTFREFTVLELVARGLTDKQIAQELGISLNTVGKHVSNILGKMEVSSRTEASVRAVQAHLLD